MKNRGVQELIYKHIAQDGGKEQPTVLKDLRIEAAHLRALLRQKVAIRQRAMNIKNVGATGLYHSLEQRPAEWPVHICDAEH